MQLYIGDTKYTHMMRTQRGLYRSFAIVPSASGETKPPQDTLLKLTNGAIQRFNQLQQVTVRYW